MARGVGLDEALGLRSVVPKHVVLPAGGGGAPYPRLLALQELRQHLPVMPMGRRGRDRGEQVGPTSYPAMRRHAEVPLVALLDLLHLWIPLLLASLRRTRGADDRGIPEGAPADREALRGQIGPDARHEGVAPLVRFQQVPKFADRRLLRHGLAAQLNPDEVPPRPRVVQRLFDRRIRQSKPLLPTMQAPHAFDTDRRTPRACGLGSDGLDHGPQLRPRHTTVHLVEQSLPAGRLALLFERTLGTCLLRHGRASASVSDTLFCSLVDNANKSDLP